MRLTVQTLNSIYEIDLDQMTAQRMPGTSDEVRPLRRDSEPVPLVSIEPVRIGRPMVMLLRIRDDGVITVRETSAVTMIKTVCSSAEERSPSKRDVAGPTPARPTTQ